MNEQWLLIVFDGSLDRGIMQAMQMRESKTKRNQYVRFYELNQRSLLEHHIDELKECGFHGIAKRVEKSSRFPSRSAEVIDIQDNRLSRELTRQAEHTAERDTINHVQSILRRARGE